MINTAMLKQRAKELGIHQKDIADALGLKQSSVNLKLNNQRPMTVDEAETIANILRISDDMFASYFFSDGTAQFDYKEMLETKTTPAGEVQGLDIDVERLGLAYCRLNRWEWDEILGPKPEGFDELPNCWKKRWPWEKKRPSKEDYISRPMRAIEAIIGDAGASRYWWKFVLGKTDGEWLHWYLTGEIKDQFQET